MKTICLGLLLIFAVAPEVFAQQARTVAGTVVDAAGEPIVGATVAVDGTASGTITANNGTFAVRVLGERPVLVVSFTGYATVRETNMNNPVITLKEDATGLDEVVAVGYGVQKMRNITGAIATVDIDEVKDLPALNMGALLKGTIPGLNISGGEARPGVGADVSIRYGTANSNYDGPLYVIDDVVYQKTGSASYGDYTGATAFSNLNPEMIESVTILKDGAAAIYGSTAGSGVILVKTKRGRAGNVQVSYSGTFTLNDAVGRPQLLSSYDYGVMRNSLAASNTIANTGITNRLTGLYQADELEAMKTLNYDWFDKAWHGSYSVRNSVNITGGTQNSSYFAGLSYSQQDTNLDDGLYTRWNYNVGVDSKLASHLKVALRVSGTIETKERILKKLGGTTEEVASIRSTPSFIPYALTDENGKSYWVSRTTFTNGSGGTSSFNYFAVEGQDNRYSDESNDLMINGNIEYDFGWSRILKGLTMRVQLSTNVFGTFHQEFGTKVENLLFRQRGGSGGHLWIDGGTQLNQYGGKLMHQSNLNVTSVNNSNRLMKDMARNTRSQSSFNASYVRSFGLHELSGSFVIERSEMEQRWLRGYKDDPIANYTEEFNGALGAASLDSYRLEGGSLSYIGRVNYAYNEKYLFEALLRSDASTKFAPENYWGMFWNLGAGWVISQEDWFRASWLDFLKFRFSYAYTGNDGSAEWAWLQRFTYNHDKGPVLGGNNNRSNGMKMERAPNRAIRWDHTYKHNFGIDARVLNGRLSIGLDAYFDRRREILTSRSGIPLTVGSNAATENYNNEDRFGGELSLGWRDKIGEVGYRISVNTGWSDGRARRRSWDTQKTPSSIVKDGPLSMGTWGYDAVGIMRTQAEVDAYWQELVDAAAAASARTGKSVVPNYLGVKVPADMYPGMVKYRDVRGERIDAESWEEVPNGVINEFDQIQLAKRTILGGANLSLGADWKGLTFQARISASWGGYQQLPDRPSLSGMDANTNNYPAFWAGNVYQPFDVLDASGQVVAPANLDARYPNMSLANTTVTSSIWHMPSFRMTLANVSFGYTLPRKWSNAASLQSVRLSLTGTNLFSFFNPYPGDFVDPLNASLSAYPTLRTFSLGVNITF